MTEKKENRSWNVLWPLAEGRFVISREIAASPPMSLTNDPGFVTLLEAVS